MKKNLLNILLVSVLFVTTFLSAAADAVKAQNPAPMQILVEEGQIRWVSGWQNQGFQLKVVAPDGNAWQQTFKADQQPVFSLLNEKGSFLADGLYTFELIGIPQLLFDDLPKIMAAREAGLPSTLPKGDLQIWTGSFTLAKGEVLLPQQSPDSGDSDSVTKDVVHADDLIVQGSLCTGMDCIVNENFGFDTVRLKENNLRIKFEDTSVGTFPSTDWQITINDSANGGMSYFAITDVDTNRNPFLIEASAPANSLYVNKYGKIGMGTSTPITELHINDTDTPTIRFEQNGGGGWLPQTWDIGANEANFFIRDQTFNYQLPFRIKPGAPTSSLTIQSDANIGMGTWSPATALHIVKTSIQNDPIIRLEKNAANTWDLANLSQGFAIVDVTNSSAVPFMLTAGAPDDSLVVSANGFVGVGTSQPQAALHVAGDAVLEGYLSERSDVNAKENFQPVQGEQVLARLVEVPISVWNYKDDQSKTPHMGAMAQDFYAAFGLGKDDTHIAALDVNGVALASIQELAKANQEKETEIQELRQTVENLESRVMKLESKSASLSAFTNLLPLLFGVVGVGIGAAFMKKRL